MSVEMEDSLSIFITVYRGVLSLYLEKMSRQRNTASEYRDPLVNFISTKLYVREGKLVRSLIA